MQFSELDRACVGCGDTEEMARLEHCVVCRRYFCPDCAHRAVGRRFCSAMCAKSYFYSEEIDEDEKPGTAE
ncbi:MAG TPA: hypothetical protein VFL80_09225 [Thermoanaerobaculia bacterium]|nr:hypothetical protein [Thermoanaerobaculia bacterium]